MSLRILFIGGTGIISSACSRKAIADGLDVYLLTRGKSQRDVPEGATVLTADMNDEDAVKEVLGDLQFDCVAQFIAFNVNHIERDLRLFAGRTRQYIFISTASAYQTPPSFLPVTESTPLRNPIWGYSQRKIACEDRLMEAYRADGFPVTIVRPSHTYDKTLLPCHGGWTVIDRLRRGKKVVVHGDGTSLWTLTHHRDFAKGFVPLMGNPAAIGQDFHITSDEWLTWDQIHEILADKAGAPAPQIVHVPSDVIARFDSGWGDSLLGDKAASMIFDNSKLKRVVPQYRCEIPFARGAEEIIQFYDENPDQQTVNKEEDALMDRLIDGIESLKP